MSYGGPILAREGVHYRPQMVQNIRMMWTIAASASSGAPRHLRKAIVHVPMKKCEFKCKVLMAYKDCDDCKSVDTVGPLMCWRYGSAMT
ncbi:hypothetical protein KC19_10G073900 [Ceratodon purpureus]|uniref:Uncharacterized protein n=1 Tax=Ceratodon purpureus TaxID=3225 RepID=A0A8T0GJ77_CERPU|nr:hypothetical protein KC19_10G073900 [Ceratodon purpureus]